jgi:polyhydroxyalkanoate synthesis regulator phasin
MKKIEQEVQEIKTDIKIIKENHLAHIESDVVRLDKKLDKMDNRVWAVLAILVASVVAPLIAQMF